MSRWCRAPVGKEDYRRIDAHGRRLRVEPMATGVRRLRTSSFCFKSGRRLIVRYSRFVNSTTTADFYLGEPEETTFTSTTIYIHIIFETKKNIVKELAASTS